MDTSLQIKVVTLLGYVAAAAALVALLGDGARHALSAAGPFG